MSRSSTAQVLTSRALADSPAYRDASLRSEVRRAYAVIAILALVFLLILLPDAERKLGEEIRVVGALAIGAVLGVQVAVLAVANWAHRHQRRMPMSVVIATVAFESLIPTAIMLWHIRRGRIDPLAILSAPPTLAYGMLVTLTTLRLRPSLCILSGSVAAAGYAGLTAYVRFGLHVSTPTTGLPYATYANAAVLIFISGVAGAWVARELRGYLEAALGEAEIRHQLARVEQDLSTARSIQQALLPREPPDIPGFDIAGWNRSADETGGDYYDWQALPDGRWIVTLADVSGHGLGPAMVTAACRAYVRASSHYHGDLASLNARVNRLLADDLPEGRFVTMASAIIDARGGPIQLLSAGHGPIVLLVEATGEVHDILADGLPLAVMADADFGLGQSIALARGDVLALVTDGFVEWARPGADGRREEFGLPRLRESLRAHAHRTAKEIIECIATDVAAFAQREPQQDDLTMVIIRRDA